MKKQFLAVLAAFSIVLTPSIQVAEAPVQTFQDKPALTKRQSNRMLLLKAGLAMATGVGGAFMGGLAWYEGFWVRRRPATSPSASSVRRVLGMSSEQANIVAESWVPPMVRSPFRYHSRIGGLGGLVFWYPLQKIITTKEFGNWYRVSYQVANICLYYNINVGQYRTILTAAESRERKAVIKEIDELYPKRFGPDWRNRMQTLFAKYAAQASSLVKRGSFDTKLDSDERDFVRMVELGAAMANLYYKTQPSRKNAMDSAMKLYKELGYLTNKGGVL